MNATGPEIGDRIRVPRSEMGVGVARRDITPPIGIRAKNWGPATWDQAEGVHRPFTLTAMALVDRDSRPRVLLAVDATWWRRVEDEWRVRSAILEGLGLAPEDLLVTLSHTHAGAVLCAADGSLDGGEFIQDYLEDIAAASISAGLEALASVEAGTIEWTTGRSSLAANRELDLDGRALVGFNPQGESDDVIVIGRVTSSAGAALATLVNYACHPTTLAWQNRRLSPDYVGAMRELIEADTGAPCLFLQGASGELAPREQYSGDVSLADRHGVSLGHAVLSALSALPPPGHEVVLAGVVESGAPLAMWEARRVSRSDTIASTLVEVELPLRILPTMEELAEQWKDIDPRSRDERLGRARNLRDGYVHGPTVQHPVWVWRAGDAIIVAHPGEAYSHLQRALRARFPEVPIVVMNLTNGPGFVYLPSRDAYERQAYQAWQTPLAPGGLERLEEHAAALIENLASGPA